MEITVTHTKYGKGVIDKSDLLKNKAVVVFFEDKKFRQVHSSKLKKVKKLFSRYEEN